MGRERFEAEFGHYTEWLVDAIHELGLHDPVPAACRGTGNPWLLAHLAGYLDLEPGSIVLDVGIGLGGPAAWLARERSCKVVGIDIMPPAARGITRLFPDLRVALATTRALPFADATFTAAWSLGVIEMIEHKQEAFEEIARVLAPGARMVLYDFVATEDQLEKPPAADRFASAAEIAKLLEAAGLRVIEAGTVPFLPQPPDEWQSAIKRVRDRIRERHEDDERFLLAEEERGNFNRLRRWGAIEEWQFRIART